MNYKEIYSHSISSPHDFWKEQANNVPWYKKPSQILAPNNFRSYDWFADGEINMCYAAVDHHVETGRSNQVAIYYDSPVTHNKQSLTYLELHKAVSVFAGVLKNMGVEKGDTVIIYMPLIPQGVIAMLACARIGAIHSVVFGGFAPHELQTRIDDAKPKVVITATCGIEVNKKIAYKPLVDKGIELAEHKPGKVIVFVRPELTDFNLIKGRDVIWQEEEKKASGVEPTKLKAIDPLYILYTSGTTGKPKGVIRRVGDHAVMLKFSMKNIYNTNPGEVFWAGSDIGWVVGHSYIVYAPLLHGCSTVIYEGKPVKTPDPGAFWRVIEEYRVRTFFTAPTAFRAIKKEDPDAAFLKHYDLSHLRTFFLAGERLDPPTYNWLQKISNKPIVDNWWQTELGSPALAIPIGIENLPPKIGSAGVPVPGFEFEVKDDNGETLGPNQKGNLTIKLPLPPGSFPTLWNDNPRYCKSYLDTYPGLYLTGDEGLIDEDGYIFVMGRIDDVINVAGHRLSTGEMEEFIGKHDAVAECAVVGVPDEIKGELPVAFVVLKDTANIESTILESELVQLIRENIGALANFKKSIVVKRLPKTRSGKILRRAIRRLFTEQHVEPPSTIDDPIILHEIKENLKNNL